jgi:Uma2 family endonuclease
MYSTLSLEIPIPTSIILHVNHEQFTELAINNPDLRLELTHTGELIVNPPTGSESSQRNSSITGQLYYWSEKNESLGVVFDSSGGFTLPNGAILSPDASWVSRERWEALTPQQRRGFAPLCPDFVIELRSATDSLSKLRKKMREYQNNGAKLGWLIDPQNKRVEIYRPQQEVEILESPTELSGENVLPGFILKLQRIWQSS